MSAELPEERQRELEDLLRRAEPEPPASGARAAARAAFLSAGTDASRVRPPARTPGAMAGSADSHALDHEPDGFAAWLAAASGATPARPEIRQRARLAFLSAAASTPATAPPSRSFRTLVLVAAAAAIVLVTLFVPEPDRWRVRLEGALALDEADFEPGAEDRLAAELERAGWVETRASGARFALGDALELELRPGSSLRFPPLPALDGLAPFDFELARGEVFVKTLAPYPGNPLRIRTDTAEVALSGTTVGVLVDAAGTCVCVAEGTALVTGARGRETVPARHSLRLYRDAALMPKIEVFPASGPEAEHVQELILFQLGSSDR